MAQNPLIIYTIGHSTRTFEELAELLHRFQIQQLVDVRTVPRSRRVPHFNIEVLPASLQVRGVQYRHTKQLGGLRKPLRDSINKGWQNASFRGFADYMQSDDFWNGVADLLRWAEQKKTAVMCAEAVPWRCHRSLIADALLIRNTEVQHIISAKDIRPHHLTPFAVLQRGRIIYPWDMK